MSNQPHKLNPFPGLRAFNQDEDYLFFGREEQTIELLQRLGGNRFVAVVGTSGSGKSSLVRCGLLSELLGGKMLQAGAAWEIAVTHPGGNPLVLLTEAMLEADLYDAEEEHARENLLATLSRSHFGLVEAVKQSGLGEDTNFLLVVDQFEEIFRFHEAGQMQREAANEFVSILLEAVAQSEVPIYVVLTMRSDFIGECGQFEGLAEMVNRGEFLIPRLSREQYKRVIEGPIKVAGGQIAPRLLQRLLNDLGQQADQLPCLQHALMRTWNVWSEKGDTDALDLDDYQRVGKMTQALSLHADEIYDSLASDRQRELCRGMFQALTVQESENRGIRRPQRLGRLCQILDVAADQLLPIIDAYRQHGVTFLMPPSEVELTDQTIIDISHESLMRVWTRLRHWVDEEAQAAGIYLRLSESAALYEQGKAGLYRDPELGIALAWHDAKRPNVAWAERYHPGFAKAIGFLEASQQASVAEEQAREAARQRELEQARQLAEAQQLRLEHQQRSARKLRIMLGGLAMVAIVAGIACVAALVMNDKANKLAALASQEKDRALRSAIKAEQSAQEADRQREVAQLAEQAMERTATQAAEQRDVAQRESYRSTIKLAESMLQGDDDARFRVADILWDSQPELRGWEWGHLMAQCPLEEWSFQADESGLQAIAATADGRFLVTANRNGHVTLWDIEARCKMWQAITGPVRTLAVDPMNRFVGVSASDDTLPQFRLLDLNTGKVTRESEQTGGAELAFSPSGAEIYVLSDQENRGTLQRIATSTAERLAQTSGIPRHLHSFFVDTAGDFVGIFRQYGEGSEPKFQFFDARTLGATNQLDGFQEQVTNVTSPSTPVLHSASGEVIYSFTSSVYRKSLDGKRSLVCELSEYVEHLAVDSDSGTVLAATANGAVQIVDADGGKQTIMHGAPITGLVTLPRGRFLTAGADGLVKCWKMAPSDDLAFKISGEPTGSTASAVFVEFGSDGGSLLCRTWDRHNFLYEIDSLSQRHFVYPDRAGNNGLFPRFRPGTNEMVADSAAGLLFFPLGSTGIEGESTRSIPISKPTSAAFDATGRILVVSSPEMHPAVYDLQSNEQLPNPEVQGSGPIAINASGTRAAMRTKEQLQVWETSTGHLLNCLDCVDDGHTQLPAVFHPDGELIAVVEHVAGSHSKLILWDSNLGRMHSMIQPTAGIDFGTCKFSADGQRLFVRCSDNKVRVFDWILGKELLALSGGKNVDALAVSPDGLTVAYAGFSPNLFVAKALPWQENSPRDAAFYRAVDDLRLFTARTARIGDTLTAAFTNRSDKPIRVDYVARDQNRTLFQLEPGATTNAPPNIPVGLVFLFIDPESSQQLESFTWAAIPLDDDEGPVGIRVSFPVNKDKDSEIAETLGDVAMRQGRHADAGAEYTKAVTMRQEIVLADPSKAAPQGRLATAYWKRLAAGKKSELDDRSEVLMQTAGFWQQLMQNPKSNPAGWQHLLSFQLRLLDHQVATGAKTAEESLTTLLPFWAGRSAGKPADRLFRYGVSEVSQRLPLVFPVAAEAEAIDQLVATQSELTAVIGETYSAVGDWESAIAVYSKGISEETVDSDLLSRRATASEHLQDWTAAAADWQRVATLDIGGGKRLTDFMDRLLEAGHSELAETVRTKARASLERRLETEPANPLVAQALTDLLLTSIGTKTLLPTSESDGVAWLSTTTQPPDNWTEEDFDDSTWKEEFGGFGAAGSPEVTVRTDWTTNDIWLRRMFEWQPGSAGQALVLRLIYDDSVEIYFNGQQVASLPTWTPKYVTHPLDAAAVGTLHAGTNTIAIHCHQNAGGQHIDVGVSEMPYEQRFAALQLTDPWAKLAAAYHLLGDHPALDKLLQTHPVAAMGVGELYAADKNWERAIVEYNKVITDETADAALLAKRAEAYFATEQRDLARADWLRATQQQPDLAKTEFDRFRFAQRWSEAAELGLLLIEQKPDDTILWVQVPPIAVLSEEEATYETLCRRILELFQESPTPSNADRAIKGCLLKPGAIDVADLPLDKLPMSIDATTAPAYLPPWFWATRALLAYRSGDAESAVTHVTLSEQYKPNDHAHALNLAVLAMAQHELKHPDEARIALEEASQLVTRLHAANKNHHDLLIAEILFREAETLINGKPEPKTADAATKPNSVADDKTPAEKKLDSDSDTSGQ